MANEEFISVFDAIAENNVRKLFFPSHKDADKYVDDKHMKEFCEWFESLPLYTAITMPNLMEVYLKHK